MRILGLDVGSKTIGIAMSDPLGWTAQGIKTISRKGDESDYKDILDLVREHQVDEIVIGLPLHMNGQEGKQADAVRAFSKNLEKILENIKIILWDERLSTVGAERVLLEAALSREKRKKVIDKMAAVFILQGYLESKRNG